MTEPGHGISTPLVELGGQAATDEQGRRRTHPLTPLVHGLKMIPSLIGLFLIFGLQNASNFSAQISDDPETKALSTWLSLNAPFLAELSFGWLVIGLAVVLVVLTTALRWVGWTRLAYWFDTDGDLRVDSGVLFRNERRLQLSRLQTVDVVQPLVARFFGMCELRIEVAGQGDSRAVLQFLTATEATSLRSEILARAAGVRPDAGEAPEGGAIRVPTSSFIVSLLLMVRVWISLLFVAFFSVVSFMADGAAGLIVFFATGALPALVVFQEFNNYYGFTVADSPDGLRLRHGLLQTYAQTVPPGRVQAVSIVEPFMWRRRGWVRLKVNLAGVGVAQGDSSKQGQIETLLIPVAPGDVADGILARALPGVSLTEIEFAGVPASAARRSPIQWKSLGVWSNDDVFVTRRGRITRHTSIIRHARTQSVRVSQGPWERVLGLASMHVDSTPGPVSVVALHRPAREARALADTQAERAARARAVDGPARWAIRACE